MNIKNKNQIRELIYKLMILGITLAMLVLPASSLVSFAQNATKNDNQNTNNNPLPTEQQLSDIQAAKTIQFLGQLNGEIHSNESTLLTINGNVNDSQQKVSGLEIKMNTLQDQINNFDTQIKNSAEIISNVQTQIQDKAVEIESLQNDLEVLNTEISFQKQNIADYLKTLYIEGNTIKNQSANNQISTLKLLLSGQKISDILNNLKYAEILQETGQRMIQKLAILIKKQKTEQAQLYIDRHNLYILNDKLTKEKNEYEIRKRGKESLLDRTKGQEKIYQQLLATSKIEQEQVLHDISTLKSNLGFIQKRMKDQGRDFNPNDYKSLLKTTSDKAIYEYLQTAHGYNALFQPRWPVSPYRGISAYFHDKSYFKIFGMQHNAIDIPTYQGTPIKAPAPGVVYKAKDNGYGYSYIILAHANGFMTVYGHVSEIDVKVGETVREGQIIGLSGATPGTKGAGLYTTGPHLHFEIIRDGVYQDPLNYLNLAYLNLKSLPQKYKAKALGDYEKVRNIDGKVPVKKNTGKISVQKMVELQGAVSE